MLVLANLSEHRIKENMALNLEGLKSAGVILPVTFQVMDAIESKPFPADQGRLAVDLQPNGFRIADHSIIC